MASKVAMYSNAKYHFFLENGAKQCQTGPCYCFYINLRMMDEKLKLNKEKMKQIYGIGLTFEIHGIC